MASRRGRRQSEQEAEPGNVLDWLDKTRSISKSSNDGKSQPALLNPLRQEEDHGGHESGAGVQVRGSALDMNDGETRILTLADASILDDSGEIRNDDNVLEDFAHSREAQLRRKKQAAMKQSLHFEEDSRRLGMLSKYDDEEDEALISMGHDGTLDDEQVQAAIVARLKEDALAVHGTGKPNIDDTKPFPFEAAREYMQPDEQTAFKKKGRKKRTRRAAALDDDAAAVNTAATAGISEGRHESAGVIPAAQIQETGSDVFADLEATTGADAGDRGSRAAKRRCDAEQEAAAAQAEQDKRSRYELALEKANRTAALVRSGAATAVNNEDDFIGADDEDEYLQRSLLKAQQVRAAALQKGRALEEAALDSVAAAVKAGKDETGWIKEEGQLETNETQAFIDSLSVQALAPEERSVPPVKDEPMEDADAPPGVEEADCDAAVMDAEDAPAAASEPLPPYAQTVALGGWQVNRDEDMWAGGVDEADDADAPRLQADGGDGVEFKTIEATAAAARQRMRHRTGRHANATTEGTGVERTLSAAAEAEGPVLFELQKGLGRGLSEALLMVRERGWLHAVDYRGRISDFKHNQRTLVEDALLSDSSALSHRVGASLQRTDEFGRILTPKEAFRDVSYAFHGYKRAASKKEKNLKTLVQGRAQAGLLDDDNVPYHLAKNPSQLLDDWKARKWRPKWVNNGSGGKGGKDSKKKVVKAQREVAGMGVEGLSGIATGSAAAAAGSKGATGARVPVQSERPAAASARAALGRAKSSSAPDKALMPPPPPPK